MKSKIVTKVFAVAAATIMAVSTPISAFAQTPVTKDNFDATRYANDYADLKAAFGSNKDALWSHYVNNGAKEGRVVYTTTGDVGTFMSADNFDYTRYANDYADLKAAFGYNKDALWNHYVTCGANEGRKAYATNGTATTTVEQYIGQVVDGSPIVRAWVFKNKTYTKTANGRTYEDGNLLTTQMIDGSPIIDVYFDKWTNETYTTTANGRTYEGGRLAYYEKITEYTGETKNMDLVYKIIKEVMAIYPVSNGKDCSKYAFEFCETALRHGFVGRIEVGNVVSERLNHEWNRILIDNVWYDVDCQAAVLHGIDSKFAVDVHQYSDEYLYY